ncbi:hypothetical protein CBR_g51103 [Chara braunii]|uniref:Uncharacterized protein n=1 Tax=Chara braunii TaxID=69332 RepID=A0A388K651_CHABU|nr:hypothetical protein CBR_g51103 [Chara braunii]|eukprot:GBG65509.1 hypothetical protein CBR_g51103 [Chara braunii]
MRGMVRSFLRRRRPSSGEESERRDVDRLNTIWRRGAPTESARLEEAVSESATSQRFAERNLYILRTLCIFLYPSPGEIPAKGR